MKLKYLHRKKIKISYEIQYLVNSILKDKIKKIKIKNPQEF
jgi:hypothetical protein